MPRRTFTPIAALVIAACTDDPSRLLTPPAAPPPSFSITPGMTLAVDQFNRADESPISGNWTSGPGGFAHVQLVSNSVRGVTQDGVGFAYYNAMSWPNDQWSEVKIASLVAGPDGGVAVRISAAGQNAYLFSVIGTGASYEVGKVVNGTYSTLTTGTHTFGAGDVVGLEVQGSTLRAFKNGVQLTTVVDASLTSGNPGIFVYSNDPGLTFDDWAGGVPGALAADAFNRPNENPIAGNWIKGGGGFGDLQLVSNAVQGASATARNVGFYNAVTWPNDQWSEVRVASLTAAQNGGPSVRISVTSETAYVFAVGTGGYYIGKRVNGVWTTLFNGTTPFAVGDVLRLEAKADTIRAFKNGALVQFVLDNTIPSGNAGIWIYQNDPGLRFDDWAGGGAAPSPPPPAPPAAPTSLTVTAVSSSQINLNWTDNATTEDGFLIEQCTGAGCANFGEIDTVGANVESYQNTGLASSTTYSYRVRAYNTGGTSPYSNTATATTSSAVLWPNQPAGFDSISSQPFDADIPGTTTGSNDPVDYTLGWKVYWNDAIPPKLIRATDASSPLSPSNVAAFRYPVAQPGGGEVPALTRDLISGRTRLYTGVWWKPDSEWEGHPSHVNKIQYAFAQGNGGSMYMAMYGAPGGPYKLAVYMQFTNAPPRWLDFNVTPPTITLGQWRKIEWLIQYGSAPQVPDGVVKWWLNGVLAGHDSLVAFPSDSLATYKLHPIWGGMGGFKSQEDFYWFDHVYISAPPP